ncbi:MAG: 30S ribosomal protein S27ae [Thermoplasmatota archaeon]
MADKKPAAKGGKGGAAAPAAAAGKRTLYKVEGSKLVRARKTCPKCGPGVFLAQHKDRQSCGACGYTEFAKPVRA